MAGHVLKVSMNKEDELRIRKCYTVLVENLIVSEVIPDLISASVFDIEKKQKIEAEKTDQKMAEKLIDILLKCGPEAYQYFLKSLERHHEHLHKTLVSVDITEEMAAASQNVCKYIPLSDEQKRSIVTEKLLVSFGSSFSDTKSVMSFFDFNAVQIEQIQNSNPYAKISNHNAEALRKWKQKNYNNATVQKLLDKISEAENVGSCSIDWDVINNALRKFV